MGNPNDPLFGHDPDPNQGLTPQPGTAPGTFDPSRVDQGTAPGTFDPNRVDQGTAPGTFNPNQARPNNNLQQGGSGVGGANQQTNDNLATGRTGATSSEQAINSQSPVNNDWRMVNYNGRWWYWTPDNNWLYQQNNQWQPYNGPLAGRNAQLFNGRRVQAGYRGTDNLNAGATTNQNLNSPATNSNVNSGAAANAAIRPNAPTETELRRFQRRLRADNRAGLNRTATANAANNGNNLNGANNTVNGANNSTNFPPNQNSTTNPVDPTAGNARLFGPNGSGTTAPAGSAPMQNGAAAGANGAAGTGASGNGAAGGTGSTAPGGAGAGK